MKKRMARRRADASTANIASVHPNPVPEYDPEHPAASIRSIASVQSIGSSIGSHKERRGSQLAEYDFEEGAIKFAINESVKSLKLTIDSDVADESDNEDEDVTEHVTNINEPHIKVKKSKKKNFLIRFEEATYKQNLEEQCFKESVTTKQCWQNAAQYDSDVEHLFTYVQVFTVSMFMELPR